jgi:hypothetical protein
VGDEVLPVMQGQEMNVGCEGELINKGGSRVRCEDGQIVATVTPPFCVQG